MRKKVSVTQLQKHVNDLTQALQRERADSVNLRRRIDDERAQLGNFYKSMVVRELLPAIDNLERALSHKPKNLRLTSSDSRLKQWEDWTKGVLAIKAQLETVFKQLGVERIKTVGKKFDPRLHEAISIENPEGENDSSSEALAKEEVVSEELLPGYKLGDEIIRHATVKVIMQRSPKLESEGEEKK